MGATTTATATTTAMSTATLGMATTMATTTATPTVTTTISSTATKEIGSADSMALMATVCVTVGFKVKSNCLYIHLYRFRYCQNRGSGSCDTCSQLFDTFIP